MLRPPLPSARLRQLIADGKKALCVGKNYREHINEMQSFGPEWKLEEEPDPVEVWLDAQVGTEA